MLNCRRGFSLVEMLMSVAVMAIAALAAAEMMISLTRAQLSANEAQDLVDLRLELQNHFVSKCAVLNSLRDTENSTLQCLWRGDCANPLSGGFLLRDASNAVVYDPNQNATHRYNKAGALCDATTASNPNLCPLRAEVRYDLVCPGNQCNRAYLVLRLNFSEAVASSTTTAVRNPEVTRNYSALSVQSMVDIAAVYLSCRDALNAGRTASGVYWIDPDGNGQDCPFEVYCDQGSDGGGWALVINSPKADDSDPMAPVTGLLYPGKRGRIANEHLTAILKASDTTRNNVKVQVKGRTVEGYGAQEFIFGLNTGGSADLGGFRAAPNKCLGYEAPSNSTTITGTSWAFFAENGASTVGFKDNQFTCMSCAAGEVCEMITSACCRQNLQGSVWIR
jgi:prepilin-type N-terminal cleavage/methylation domain-containing protein